MNLEPPAQLPSVHSLLHRKPHKFTPLFHNRHLAPRHGWPPLQPIPCNDDVSVMSPNTRRGCPRAIHSSRPSTPLNLLCHKTWMPGTRPGMTRKSQSSSPVAGEMKASLGSAKRSVPT